MTLIKKISSFVLALMLAVSCCAFSSSAARNYNVKTRYSGYTTCIRTANRDAYVTIKVYNTSAGYRNDVKMTTTSGRTIWSESGAIANNGSRKFRLGTDYKTFRIYVRTRGGSAAVRTISWNYCTTS